MSATVAPAVLRDMLGEGWRRPGEQAEALADALRALLVDGRVAVRTRVPSERALADALGVSRGTVSRAYDALRADGFLVSARGAGSRLALPDAGNPIAIPHAPDHGDALNLAIAALPAPEPWLSRAAARAAAGLTRHTATPAYATAGLPDLREALAAHLTRGGVATTADQVLVTSGAQQALTLVLMLLCAPGERVLVDAPAYARTLSALARARARPVAVPLTPAGWDADAWTATLAGAAPRLAVTIPDFHNPTGLTMGAEERAVLARACARAGVTLVADETTRELRLDGPAAPPPLAAQDAAGTTVLTIGTMSKAAWGGLRLGWVRAAPRTVRELAVVRADLDLASPVLDQLVALELLADWDDVVASRRALLRPRRDALLAALAEHAPAWTARRPHGGLCAWVRMPAPVATRLATAAARERLLFIPGPSFSVDGAFEHHLRLPFTLPEPQLAEAVARLARLAAALGPRTPAATDAAAPPVAVLARGFVILGGPCVTPASAATRVCRPGCSSRCSCSGWCTSSSSACCSPPGRADRSSSSSPAASSPSSSSPRRRSGSPRWAPRRSRPRRRPSSTR